jgi:transketolase
MPTFRSFGWRVVELDGHDFGQIRAAFALARGAAEHDRPTVLLAHTVKGKGLSFAEGKHKWHTGVATNEELAQARIELAADDLVKGAS